MQREGINHMHVSSRRGLGGGLLLVTTLAVAGCATSATAPSDSAPAELEVGALDLSGSCPATVVIQADWNPESEHGTLYELVGPDPVIDSANKTVTGPLMADGEYTGVNVQVRAGGPAIGYQSVQSMLYTDPDILMGYVETVDAIMTSADLPVVSVFAQFEGDPTMVMWDPETYPDAESIHDLGEAGVTLLTYDGEVKTDWLINEGLYPAELIDRSYDGTPASFVAQGGTIAQTGYITAEPYVYEHDVEAWMRPVATATFGDEGWPSYTNTLAVRTDDVAAEADCLKGLVPVLQRAAVTYLDDPAETNELIVALVAEYDTGWVYEAGVAEFAAERARDLGLVSNGDDETVGDMSEQRVTDSIELMGPIMTATGAEMAEGLAPEDLFTNEFIDPSIGLE